MIDGAQMHKAQFANNLAKTFLEVLPKTMWLVRAEIRLAARRKSRGALSVPQIRVLAQLNRSPKTNGELAEILGVSVPAMSRLVDGLVRRRLVLRMTQRQDRRSATLSLSPAGRKYFVSVMRTVETRFSKQFAALNPEQSRALAVGLGILQDAVR